MTAATAAKPTLIDRIWPQAQPSWIRAVLLAVVGSLLLIASAKVKVPFEPVPVTMQTFAVLVIGMAYGWRLAAGTVLLYLAQGAVGLPVFTDTPERGIGLVYMTGRTGGYLIGFAIAATAMGWLAERGWGRTLPSSIAAMVIGLALMFAPGVVWLSTFIGWDNAVKFGVMPFLYGEALKLVLASALLPLAWRRYAD